VGSLIISIDAELGWGFHDLPDPPVDRLEAARSGWTTLFDILEQHDVPATWAVVGHLLLKECDGVHTEHPSIDGWFDGAQSYWLDRSELQYGPDLVADLIEAEQAHEIACHSFSHTLFDDPRVSREIAQAELERAIEVGESLGIAYDSFIFPRNAVGFRELLAEHDFTCYRGRGSTPSSRLRRTASKFVSAATGRASLVTPLIDEYGLVNIPPSLFLFGFEGRMRDVATSIAGDPIVRQARRGIDRASLEDGVFHVWLHPNNIQDDSDARRIRSIIEYAAQKRDHSELQIETMATVAERTRSTRDAVRIDQ